MRCYRSHGLNIRSSLDLPELLETTAAAELTIEEGSVGRLPAVTDAQGRGFWSEGDRACYRLEGAGTYLVESGQRILVDADPRASRRAVRIPLLGPALALALHQRGRFSLHASAVAVGERSVVFMGGFGMGKSTTAAALVVAGHRLVADDLATFRRVGSETLVEAGFPQVRLWPDAARALGVTPESLPLVHPDHEKRAWRVEDRFVSGPLPLARFYLLDGGDRVVVEPLSQVEGLEAVLHNWYGARFGSGLFATLDLRHHFLAASRIVHDTSVRRLRRPLSLEGLELAAAIGRAIRDDLDR